jgi:hypothetical protein
VTGVIYERTLPEKDRHEYKHKLFGHLRLYLFHQRVSLFWL